MLDRLKKILNQLPLHWLRPRRHRDTRQYVTQEKIRGYLSSLGNVARFFPLVDSYTEETAEIRAAYRVMLRDPYIKAAVFTKTLAVAALDPQSQPASARKVDRRAADFVKYCLLHTQGGMRRVSYNVILHGLLEGFSVCEKIWAVADRGKYRGKVVLKQLKAKDTRHLVLEGDSYRNVTAVRDLRAGLTYHPSNFVIWSHLPLYDSPVGMSDLRAAYRAYWLVDTAWRLRAIGMERYGLPIVVGNYTRPEDQQALETHLESLRSQSWVTLPEGAKLEALQIAAGTQGDFESAIRDLREEAVIGVAGAVLQMLQGQVADGRGSSEVHKSTAELYQWWLAAEVGDVASSQIAPDLVSFNYPGADYPLITLGGVNDAALTASLQIDQGLKNLGLELSKEELYRRYNRQKPAGPEDALGQQGAGGMGGLPFAEGKKRGGRR